MKRKVLILISGILLLFLGACGQEGSSTNEAERESKLKIYTTIYPFQYFTERIGGDKISTKNIVPPGSDAHSTEMTTKEMVKLAESDAFIHSGTGLEGFVDAVNDAIKNEDIKIVNATKGIDLISAKDEEESLDEHSDEENNKEESEEGHDENGSEMNVDPHVWLDPIRSVTVAENIKNALVELDPDNKEEFEKNFNSLKNDLQEMNTEFKNMVNSSATKTFIVSHSAYGYWEDVYGLKQIGISGLSPTDEPSQKELIEIINLVKENNLQYIYFEPNLTNKVAKAVSNETDAETLTLQNLESMSKKDLDSNEDYLSIMRKNIESLKQGLNQD
ncbi:metal ABC transporter solute-binding protein, Zn/Mn family [Paenisporosarcina sp. TG20]|uniref:metal ABC transporter solute-binding protein, Zn/Mn family n=1 Tax=Paenisporosarcina sp. TG20 TaxID=1211706 RepID=UPI0002F25924|nr:zinc ABC transporter substrate-binding protein [Paenisporosarcina sp. TG20]